MDPKKAYGVLAAMGKKLGEAEKRGEGAPLQALRAATTRDAFRHFLETYPFNLPGDLVEDFAGTLTDDNWERWRSMLLLQAKMTAEDRKPTMGHEAGRGVRPG